MAKKQSTPQPAPENRPEFDHDRKLELHRRLGQAVAALSGASRIVWSGGLTDEPKVLEAACTIDLIVDELNRLHEYVDETMEAVAA